MPPFSQNKVTTLNAAGKYNASCEKKTNDRLVCLVTINKKSFASMAPKIKNSQNSKSDAVQI